jgi:hypothetical protein
VHEEDLAVEVSSLSGVDVRSVLVTGHVRGWGRHGYSKLRAEWLECALADAACRAARHWRVVAHVDAPVDLARAIVTWAGGAGLRQIVAMRPEPGPLDDVLPEVHQALADAGVRLALCDRPEDLVLRPMAKRGFFDFWKTLSPKLRHRWEMDLFRDASGFSNGRAPS